jgi:putative ABC transport system permease protein
MLKNYFKTAWRNQRNEKAYSIINVLGLALGTASCLVITLVVQYELSYDKFHSKADRTYRVTLNALDFNPSVSLAVGEPLRNDFPELERVTQVWYRESGLITIGNKKFEEKAGAFADEYFFSVFDYQWIEGNYQTALKDPNSIVLTETVAKKYFGAKVAMGQVINFNNNYNLKVTGIVKDPPGNTHLPLRYMVSFETIKKELGGMLTAFYAIGGAFTYIVTPPGYDVADIGKRIPDFIKKNWGEEIAKDAKLPLQPLADIHFDTRYLNNTVSYTTSKETYYVLAAVAALIIVIACINFINLATAQGIRRAREVGVRKVLGSSRIQLVVQFLCETALIVLVALFLGLILTASLLPQLATWLDIKVSVSQLAQPSLIIIMSVTAAGVIILAGLYPAFVQSGFRPIESLKNKPTLSFAGLTLRKSLVVVQFTISQVMIIGTLVIAYQMDFFTNQSLGFNKEAVISIDIPDTKKSKVLEQQLTANPGVNQISFSSGAPGINGNWASFTSPERGVTKGDVTEVKFVDEHYMDMLELKILAGDKVRKNNKTENDSIFDVVVNEAMIAKLNIVNLKEALGQRININGSACTISGVIRDFQSESKHKKRRPCVLLYLEENFGMVSVKLNPGGINKTIADIEKSWATIFPEDIFSYEFVDDHIAEWYRQEQKQYTAFKLFASVAILIGCLGLYGLVAFAAAQRTKEVGIRKVLGASLTDIIVLFSREFVLLIAIAFLIAAPIAYLMMDSWLHNFAYQIKIGPNIFLIAILSSVIIAACTIAYQAIKAAITNPVNSLRVE